MAKTLDAAGVKRLIQEIKGANKNLNTPIPISTENTTESMAQNVKNIADYVEKAKAAGVANVNGMGVTCIIDGENSGVGYLYVTNTQVLICGILAYEDNSVSCISVIDGTYGERPIVVEGQTGQITSDMLVEGARNPIIITGDMTEVDEETYQKLSQEGTDVILNLGDGNGSFIGLQGIFNTGDTLILMFGYSDFNESDNGTIVTYTISINTSAPHTLTFAATGACNPVPKSELTPVLQEIDLIGTDAERKAKLDQFETDWKALTGASDLTGARFVGKFEIQGDVPRNVTGIMTYCAGDTATEKNDNCFYGICNGYSFSEQKSQIAVKVSCTNGSLTITPLFSHLEAITIYTDKTPEHMQANLDNIAAYKANLQALGVDITKGWNAPVKVNAINGISPGIFASSEEKTDTSYTIISGLAGEYPYIIRINKTSGASTAWEILCDGRYYSRITTNAKSIISAINEINANAVHKDKFVPTLEAIAIRTGNTPEAKAVNVAAIKAYVDNLKALGIDTTKGYTIPIRTSEGIIGEIYPDKNNKYRGFVIRDINSYAIIIEQDGTLVTWFLLDSKSNYATLLTTNNKRIIPAINEVNDLAKGYSTIFTPIELTTETAQNKTAIDARVAAFTAQGISLTNGCCIPVTYKGVYAGNISLINGDWYGLLVKNTNNPADNINIKLSADGTIAEGNSAQ